MPALNIEEIDWSTLTREQLLAIRSRAQNLLQKRRPPPRPAAPALPEHLGLAGDRYSASVASVIPQASRDQLASERRCFLGCSLGSKNSAGAHLEGSIRWVSENFDHCTVLVADSIYRYTLQVTRGLDPAEALPAALAEGRRFMEQHRALLAHYSQGRCRFELRLMSELERSAPDFATQHAALQALYLENERFRGTVNGFADHYLGRGEQASAEVSAKQAIAVEYLLEEAAHFCCMVIGGTRVSLYPGSIKTFEEIIAGDHPGVPEALKRVVLVALRLKRTGAPSAARAQEVAA